METVNVIFSSSPMTCFNSLTGRKIADNLGSVALFDNQWCYCCYIDGYSALIDAEGNVLVENQRVGWADGKFYSIYQDDEKQSVFSADGKLLLADADDVDFLVAGWFVVSQNGANTLYNPEGEAVVVGNGAIKALENGSFFMVEDKKGYYSLYSAKGDCIAQNVRYFSFASSSYFYLEFEDKIVIYDLEAHTEFAVNSHHVDLWCNKMFSTDAGNGKKALYKADGKLVLNGFDEYICYDNGLILASNGTDKLCLFDENARKIVDNVISVTKDSFSACLAVATENDGFFFGENGELLATSVGQPLCLCNGKTFLVCDVKTITGTLYRHDLSVIAYNVYEAMFFSNGWGVFMAPRNPNDKDYVWKLIDDKGNLVTTSPYVIEYFEEHNAYTEIHDDLTTSLVLVDFGEVVTGAEGIVVWDDFYLVKKGDWVDLFSFSALKSTLANKDSVRGIINLPIWSGALQDFKDHVFFCGGSDIEEFLWSLK